MLTHVCRRSSDRVVCLCWQIKEGGWDREERCGRKVRMRKLGESADSEVGSGSIGFFPEQRVRFVAHDKREPQLERRARGRTTLRGAASEQGICEISSLKKRGSRREGKMKENCGFNFSCSCMSPQVSKKYIRLLRKGPPSGQVGN